MEQPKPVPNDSRPVWELVIEDAYMLGAGADGMIADMMERDKIGEARYGTRLQPFNGRDALIDAYQESLDLCVYLRQYLEEHKGDEPSGYSATVFNTYVDALRVCYDIRKQLESRGDVDKREDCE